MLITENEISEGEWYNGERYGEFKIQNKKTKKQIIVYCYGEF
jgi:hypothetical protein